MNATNFKKYLPCAAAVLAVAYFAYFAFYAYKGKSPAGDFNYRDFGRIPVIDGGRHKPLDTVARSTMMVITHRQSFYDYDGEKRYPAVKWMLDAMVTSPTSNESFSEILFVKGAHEQPAWNHKVFRIENDELLQMLDLKMRDGLRYSFNEIAFDQKGNMSRPFAVYLSQLRRARNIDPKNHNLLESKIVELYDHLQLMNRLSAHMTPLVIPNPDSTDQWKTFAQAVHQFGPRTENLPDGPDAKTYEHFRALLQHYDRGEKAAFNQRLAQFLKYLEAEGRMGRVDLEVFFNEFAPFYHCLELYVVLALATAFSWLWPDWSDPVRRAAYAAMGITFVVHFAGLILRMILQDRLFVFVTNLYSSAVFIGLGCVFACLILEWLFKNGIAIVVGSATGFCTLIIAHILSLDGDTMVMMQAVLDTNFWLATHVTCITLGYTTAFVAGGMGIAYIFLGLFTDKLRGDGSANLTRMTYGVLCAGMFLSFVGTVLGGLWADYSWGRFWGWDPKENGALLIVIWIALILHARWGGMVKHRGIAVLSVLGTIVTSWSWFGTNFLGVGLHAYGGAKGAAMAALILIDLGFLAIAGLGCLPLEMWQSFRPLTAPPPTMTALPGGPTVAATAITPSAS
ncbi:MAG: cytochrome c biogenesis protein CcsA [Planctomycetes bacterium]|nr:cytochrome c biogenesis protein CcsA [Planctomycetota bacterium]